MNVPTNESPDEINARITREMWADWENRFKPFEDFANDTILDPEQRSRLNTEALQNSQDTVNTAFDRAETRIQTLAGRLPQDTDPQVQESRDRQSALARRGASVDAYNTTNAAIGDREIERLAG